MFKAKVNLKEHLLLLPKEIMNVDMNGQFYYRNIPYNEIEEIHFDGTDIVFTFNIGKVPMKQIKTKDVKAFVDYVESKIK